jgi:hypothetical protein
MNGQGANVDSPTNKFVEFWLSGRLLLRGGAQRAPNKENGNNDFGIRLAASRPILLGLGVLQRQMERRKT